MYINFQPHALVFLIGLIPFLIMIVQKKERLFFLEKKKAKIIAIVFTACCFLDIIFHNL